MEMLQRIYNKRLIENVELKNEKLRLEIEQLKQHENDNELMQKLIKALLE